MKKIQKNLNTFQKNFSKLMKKINSFRKYPIFLFFQISISEKKTFIQNLCRFKKKCIK